MAKVVLTNEAKEDIKNILRSVAEFTGSETSAIKLRDEFLGKLNLIGRLPKACHLQPNGNRQAFCRRYRIVYREISNDEIHVITVIHCLRKYP